MSSAKSRPFCLGLYVLTQGCRDKLTSFLQTTYFSERKSQHFDTDFFKVVCKGPAENKLINQYSFGQSPNHDESIIIAHKHFLFRILCNRTQLCAYFNSEPHSISFENILNYILNYIIHDLMTNLW